MVLLGLGNSLSPNYEFWSQKEIPDWYVYEIEWTKLLRENVRVGGREREVKFGCIDPLVFKNVGREQGSESGEVAQHGQERKGHERKLFHKLKEKSFKGRVFSLHRVE